VPLHGALPFWLAYDLKERNTMILGTPPLIEKDPCGEERRFAAGSPYRQPGTYEP
jgi:hypothetical protein